MLDNKTFIFVAGKTETEQFQRHCEEDIADMQWQTVKSKIKKH